MTDINQALRTASTWVDEISGVVAVGQGEHEAEPCIDVWVTATADRDRIPNEQDGVPVIVRDSGGEISAQNTQT